MIHKIVAIYDVKAEAYLKPIFVQSNGVAIRSFAEAVNDGQSDFSKHPEDYSMFALGSFDDSTGFFDLDVKSKKQIAHAMDLVHREEPSPDRDWET